MSVTYKWRVECSDGRVLTGRDVIAEFGPENTYVTHQAARVVSQLVREAMCSDYMEMMARSAELADAGKIDEMVDLNLRFMERIRQEKDG